MNIWRVIFDTTVAVEAQMSLRGSAWDRSKYKCSMEGGTALRGDWKMVTKTCESTFGALGTTQT